MVFYSSFHFFIPALIKQGLFYWLSLVYLKGKKKKQKTATNPLITSSWTALMTIRKEDYRSTLFLSLIISYAYLAK